MPTAPVPANRSSQMVPSKGPAAASTANRCSLRRSEVGRSGAEPTACSLRPRSLPAMMRIFRAPWARESASKTIYNRGIVAFVGRHKASMLMRSWSLPAGQWWGINLRIHLAFLFLLAFVWFTQSQNIDPRLTFPRALAFTVMVFGSVIAHELGHLFATAGKGTLPKALVLLPTGGLAVHEITAGDEAARRIPWQRELRRALAGPGVNLIIAAGAAALIMALIPQDALVRRPVPGHSNLPRSVPWTNLFLAGLNLLPAYPLDGGRVLRALLARDGKMDFDAATRRAVNFGNLFAVLLMFAGLWDYWFMLAGFFLFLASQMEERTLLFQSVLESVRMEEVMLTDFATLSPADTLEDALSKAVHTLQDDFPVIRGTDMVGVVTKQKIMDALRGDGNAYVQSIMDRAYETTNKNESLATAFSKFTQRGMTILPVVDE